MTETLGELCAGYGGLGMAVEKVFKARLAWYSEYDEAPSKILSFRWPGVSNLGDMTKINWTTVEPVTVLSAGTPCQDLSHAGARKGMTEGTRSNLWVQMREAIATLQPTWVVWENVRGAYSAGADSDLEYCPGCMGDPADRGTVLRALGRVLGDLSDLGYDTQWRGLRASDVGAPHARFRVFVLAYDSRRVGRDKALEHDGGSQAADHRAGVSHESDREPLRIGPLGEATSNGYDLGEHRSGERPEQDWRGQPADGSVASADAEGLGWGEGRTEPAGVFRGLAVAGDSSPAADASRATFGEHAGESSPEEAWTGSGHGSSDHRGERPLTNWGPYEPAIRRWEARLGRPAPRPTEPTGRDQGERLSPRFTEWMMGLPDGWVTDPAIGISRNEQLKACGNGVVPQQAIAALQDMLKAFRSEGIAA